MSGGGTLKMISGEVHLAGGIRVSLQVRSIL
jgi:hypothetical protein